jgi:hypothetical protein
MPTPPISLDQYTCTKLQKVQNVICLVIRLDQGVLSALEGYCLPSTYVLLLDIPSHNMSLRFVSPWDNQQKSPAEARLNP